MATIAMFVPFVLMMAREHRRRPTIVPPKPKFNVPEKVQAELPVVQVTPTGCFYCGEDRVDTFVTFPCGHKMHQACSKQWLAEDDRCPECRHLVCVFPLA